MNRTADGREEFKLTSPSHSHHRVGEAAFIPASNLLQPEIGMPTTSQVNEGATPESDRQDIETTDRKTRLVMIEESLGFFAENNDELDDLMPLLGVQANPLAVQNHLEDVYKKQDTEKARATARIWNPSIQGKERARALATSKIDPIDALWSHKKRYGSFAQKAAVDRSLLLGFSELIATRMDSPNQQLSDAPDLSIWMKQGNGDTRRGLISLAQFSEINNYVHGQGEDVLHKSKLISEDPDKDARIQAELASLPKRTLLKKAEKLVDALANKSLFWADREKEAAEYYSAIRSGRIAIRNFNT